MGGKLFSNDIVIEIQLINGVVLIMQQLSPLLLGIQ